MLDAFRRVAPLEQLIPAAVDRMVQILDAFRRVVPLEQLIPAAVDRMVQILDAFRWRRSPPAREII